MSTGLAVARAEKAPLVRVSSLNKQYVQTGMFRQTKFRINALHNVSLDIPPLCLTAVVGESGSGKSTLASCIAMLEKPDSGEVWFGGNNILHSGMRDRASLRRQIQLVLQDSSGALNPRFSAAQIVAEPLDIQGQESKEKLHTRACELMEEVGLSPGSAHRRPHEFSGGQRQRLAIARAISLRPTLLILDESLSGLDLVTQSQILRLLVDLQTKYSLTYLLISHDLSLVGEIADYIAVIQNGEIVEYGSRQEILGQPKHPRTCELLASALAVETFFRNAHSVGAL